MPPTPWMQQQRHRHVVGVDAGPAARARARRAATARDARAPARGSTARGGRCRRTRRPGRAARAATRCRGVSSTSGEQLHRPGDQADLAGRQHEREEQRAERPRTRTMTPTHSAIARGTSRPGSRVSREWKPAISMPVNSRMIPPRNARLFSVDVGHQRLGRERDLRRVALQQERRAEDDDQHRREDRARRSCRSTPIARRGADARAGSRAWSPQKNAEHHDDEEDLVRRERRVDRVGQARGHEREHGGEPRDVLGVVAPDRQEPGAPAERLA